MLSEALDMNDENIGRLRPDLARSEEHAIHRRDSGSSALFSGKDRLNTIHPQVDKSETTNKGSSKFDDPIGLHVTGMQEGDERNAMETHSFFGEGDSNMKEATTQRFSTKINGSYYLVRVVLGKDEQTTVEFFDVKEGRTTRVKKLHRRWLDSLSPTVRQSLLTSSTWFRDNAATIFGAVKTMAPRTRSTPLHKPNRRPPPVPADEGLRIEVKPLTGSSFLNDTSDDDQEFLRDLLEDKSPTVGIPSPTWDEVGVLNQKVEELSKEVCLKNEHISSLEEKLKEQKESTEAVQNENKLGTQLMDDLEVALKEIDLLKAQLSESENGRLSLKAKQEEQEAVIGQLRLAMMDMESEKEKMEVERQQSQKDLDNAFAECEAICKQVQQQSEIEGKQLQVRNKLLTDMVEEVRLREENAEVRLQDALRDAEDQRQLQSTLQLRVKALEEELNNERITYKERILELEESLEIMTRSKNENREYGATMKSKLVDLQTTFAEKYEEYQEEKKTLEENVIQQESQLKQLRSELEEEKSQATTLKNETTSLQKETAFLAHKLDEALKNEASLAEELKLSEEQRIRAEEEREILVLDRKERLVEFENQLRKRRAQFEDDLSKLKVQLFDANEGLKAKAGEVEELSGYVQTLLDQQDAIQAKLCSECTSKVMS